MSHYGLIQALQPLHMIPVSILLICLAINPLQILQALQTDPQDGMETPISIQIFRQIFF